MSCSGAPCKVVISFAKRSLHAGGFFRRQDLLPPIPERPGRRAAAMGRNIERPAEMLARMAKPDAQAVVPADFVIERADIFELLGKRGRGLGYAGFEPASDLARQPGLALRTAADHHGVGAGFFERGDRLVERGDVAI